jgi:hypothetical protein
MIFPNMMLISPPPKISSVEYSQCFLICISSPAPQDHLFNILVGTKKRPGGVKCHAHHVFNEVLLNGNREVRP